MRGRLILTVTVLFLAVGISALGAAQAEGAQTTTTSGNETADTSGASNVTIDAGAVSNVDVDQTSLTDKWAGFYGTISGTKVLGSASNNLYSWTADSLSDAKVLTTPQGEPTPTSVSAVTDPNTFFDNYDTGEYSSGAANASATFNLSKTVDVLGNTVSGTAAVETFNSSELRDSRFTTYLTNNDDTSDSPVFVADSNSDASGFDGSTVNYQQLVGVGDSASSETFTFYLELP